MITHPSDYQSIVHCIQKVIVKVFKVLPEGKYIWRKKRVKLKQKFDYPVNVVGFFLLLVRL